MEQPPRRSGTADEATSAVLAAATFVDTVRQEQLRYLAAVGAAQMRLSSEAPLVAAAAAVHVRFTRQLFDAQRTLLQRRGEVDQALRQSAATDRSDAVTVDEAGEAALHRLTALLDAWWREEVAAGNARLHAASTTCEPTGTAGAQPVPNSVPDHGCAVGSAPTSLPALAEQLLTTLRAAEPAELTTVLAEMAAALGPAGAGTGVPARLETQCARTPVIEVRPAAAGALITLEPLASTGAGDPWMQFWNQGTGHAMPRRPRRWLQLGSVASSALAMIVVPLVMAWAR